MKNQEVKSRINLLTAYKDVLKRDYKFKKTKRLEKKLEDVSLALELSKASISKKRNEKKQEIEKKCMMCGEPTKNTSGFCDKYAGSAFGCKESWKAEYRTMPTKEELNASWRDQ